MLNTLLFIPLILWDKLDTNFIIYTMDTGYILSVLQESVFVILVFVSFLVFAMVRGRQGLINLIMGLYFALLISLQFPYYETIIGNTDSPKSESILMILVFAAFTAFSTILFGRLMPREYDETAFESFGKKLAFASAATVLVMIFSYHVLPITEFVDPGSPMQWLFGPENRFFWWLLVPLAVLFFL